MQYLALTLILILSAASAQAEPPTFNGRQRPYTQLSPVRAAPLVPMHTAKGGITNLRRYRGKVVLLNIWATWCPACLHELPSLDRLAAERSGKDLAVLTLSVDAGGLKDVLPYFRRLGNIHLPALMDPAGRVSGPYGLREGLPWTFIIDRKGRLRGYVMGAAEWNSRPARALLDYYIAEP